MVSCLLQGPARPTSSILLFTDYSLSSYSFKIHCRDCQFGRHLYLLSLIMASGATIHPSLIAEMRFVVYLTVDTTPISTLYSLFHATFIPCNYV